MTKIYYLQQEVKLNDEIDFKGLKIKLTQEIIDNNPNLFILKEETIFPEYVKCVGNTLLKHKLDIGKIYKTKLEYFNEQFGVIINEDHNDYLFCNHINIFNKIFQPSTKEEYDKQQEQIHINNIIEEAKKKFPVGSYFKQGNFIYMVFDNKDKPYKYDDLGFITVYVYEMHSNQFGYMSVYNLNTKIWAEPYTPEEKSFEDYKQELLNETPYAYLITVNEKLFYIELLSRIANDLNGDWKYKPNDDYYALYYSGGMGRYNYYWDKSEIMDNIKFYSRDIAEKFLKLVPNNILDLIYKF